MATATKSRIGTTLAKRRLDQHQAGDVGEATADPVAGRRQEAEIVAEAFLGIGIDAGVELGLALRQGLEDEGQHQHAGAGDAPGDQGAQHAGRPAKGRRQGEDARADHRPHDQGDEGTERKFLIRRRCHRHSRDLWPVAVLLQSTTNARSRDSVVVGEHDGKVVPVPEAHAAAADRGRRDSSCRARL
jgi:hypothetical protein